MRCRRVPLHAPASQRKSVARLYPPNFSVVLHLQRFLSYLDKFVNHEGVRHWREATAINTGQERGRAERCLLSSRFARFAFAEIR